MEPRLDRDVRRSMHRLRYPYSALRGGPGGPGGFDTGPGDAWRLLPLRRVGLASHVPQQRPRVVPRLDRRAAVLPDSVARRDVAVGSRVVAFAISTANHLPHL